MTSTIKALVKIETVPDGELVKKLGGTTPYIVLRNIKIHNLDGRILNIQTDNNTVFIMNGKNINCISNSTEVIWETDLETLNKVYKNEKAN